MTESAESSPYFALINHEYTTGVRLSNVYKYCEYAIPVIDTLMKHRMVYGQRFLFEDDMLLVYVGESVSKKVIEGLQSYHIRPPLNAELLSEQLRHV